MNIIGVIPARGGSQRLPGKNIKTLCGKPVIAYVIEAALQASMLDRVIVSTDNREIAAVSKDYGSEVIIRPDELAAAGSPIDDSLRHVVNYLKSEEGLETDIVVLMQANNPVRKAGEIDETVRKLINTPTATAVATAYKITQRPEWAKVVIDEKTNEIQPFLGPIEKFRIQDLPLLYLLDGSVLAVKREVLDKTAGDRRAHAYLGDRVHILVHDSKYAVEIDDAEDFALAEYHLSRSFCKQ